MQKKNWERPPHTGAAPGLLQDDSRALSRWFASRPDARYIVRLVAVEHAKARQQRESKRRASLSPESVRS